MNTTTIDRTGSGRPPGLLINRNYALLWGGQAVSTLGDFVFFTTLILWIAADIGRGQPWAPLAISGLLLVEAIPIVVVGPLAGVFVDRWERRRTMLAMDLARALLILPLLPLTGLVPLPFAPGGRLPVAWQLGAIYGVVLLATACSQFFAPSRLALTGDIVAEPYRARASSLAQVTIALAEIVGPPLAAPLFFGLGAAWALLVNALSFGISFLAVLLIQSSVSGARVVPGADAGPTNRDSFLRELRAGLHFFAGSRMLMTLLVSVVIAMLGAGALNALDIFFVTGNLHASASLYGLLGAAFGAGSLAGAVVAGLIAGRIGVARMFGLSLLAAGMLLLTYARLTSFAPAVVTLFLAGMPIAAVNVAIGPLLLHATPREMIGRVSAVLMPATTLASMLSIVLAGYLASTVLRGFHAVLLGMTWGPIDTIFSAAGLLAIAGGIYATVNLRRVTLATADDKVSVAPAAGAPEAAPVEQ